MDYEKQLQHIEDYLRLYLADTVLELGLNGFNSTSCTRDSGRLCSCSC